MSNKISPIDKSLKVPTSNKQEQQRTQQHLGNDQPEAPQKHRRQIFSISRLTQMARTRTVEQNSPIKTFEDQISNTTKIQDGGSGTSRRTSRLRSQSSILSFASQSQRSRPIDTEGEKFLRRFATNNTVSGMEIASTSDDITIIRWCITLFSGNYVIDPGMRFHYRWLQLISLAVSYNIIFIIGRGVFWNMHNYCPKIWYTLDYASDFIYLLDMIAQSRTGYLEQGILVRQSTKLARHYIDSFAFKLDLLSLIPTDLAYLTLPTRCIPNRVPCSVIVRANRLLRFHRLAQFFERTESATNFPFVFRISKLVFYILVIIHWNACVYFALSYIIGFGSDRWVYQPAVSPSSAQNQTNNSTTTSSVIDHGDLATRPTANINPASSDANNNKNDTVIQLYDDANMIHDPLVHQYIYCFYWSTLTLTTIGEVPMPERDEEYLFVVIDLLLGMLIFATIVGNIGSMITSMNAARAEFQHKMDSVKQWMKFRKVNKELEDRIIKWFDYLWANRQTLDEEAVTAILPDRLKAETAIHVHLETLKRVQLFQDCEPGLLVQLVLKLKLQVFSPSDFICRVGDVGKEMYIVKRGELNVLSEDCAQVYGKLTDGSVFGELSILNISGVKTGNRRTANVRSVGYSDLFALSKQDLWQVLEDYPDAKTMLIDRGKEILRKDGLLIEDRVPQSSASQMLAHTTPSSSDRRDCSTPTIEDDNSKLASSSTGQEEKDIVHDEITMDSVTNDRIVRRSATLNGTMTATTTTTSIPATTTTTSSTKTAPNQTPNTQQQQQKQQTSSSTSTTSICPLYHHMLAMDCQELAGGTGGFRTASLFGLSGDSGQLEQLMMNFQIQQQQNLYQQQQQQQQQQQCRKPFPFQSQAVESSSATSKSISTGQAVGSCSRSSIIRKRQSLHAVFEGLQGLQQRQQQYQQLDGRFGLTSGLNSTRLPGDDDQRDYSKDLATKSLSRPGKILQSANKQSSLGKNNRSSSSSVMKKSLSFALPSQSSGGASDVSNYKTDHVSLPDKGVNDHTKLLAKSSTKSSFSWKRTNSASSHSLNSCQKSELESGLDVAGRPATTAATSTEFGANLKKRGSGLDGSENLTEFAIAMMRTLDNLSQETSQTQALIRASLDKLCSILDMVDQSTKDGQSRTTTKQGAVSNANADGHSYANKISVADDVEASNLEQLTKCLSNLDLAGRRMDDPDTIVDMANKQRPATANGFDESKIRLASQTGSKSTTGDDLTINDVCIKPGGPKRPRLKHSNSLYASQSDGCLTID